MCNVSKYGEKPEEEEEMPEPIHRFYQMLMELTGFSGLTFNRYPEPLTFPVSLGTVTRDVVDPITQSKQL